MLWQIFHHARAQLDHARIGGVSRVALVQAGDAGIQDRRRRDKIRFTDAEADNIVHGGGNVKVAADSRWRHRLYSAAQAAFMRTDADTDAVRFVLRVLKMGLGLYTNCIHRFATSLAVQLACELLDRRRLAWKREQAFESSRLRVGR